MATTKLMDKPRESARKAIERVKEQKPKLDAAMERAEDVSSPLFIGLAAGSIIGSIALFLRRSKAEATFVGLWAPTFLLLGVLNRLARIEKAKD